MIFTGTRGGSEKLIDRNTRNRNTFLSAYEGYSSVVSADVAEQV